MSENCGHESYSGDEGPVAELPGGWPVRWRCDGCGYIKYDDDALAALRRLVGAAPKAGDGVGGAAPRTPSTTAHPAP